VIDLSGVVVRYPGASRPALDNVSLTVGAGESVALVGPSGSGKTTLLRAINGLIPIASGTIRVDGITVKNLHGATLRNMRRRLAMIAQHHDLVDRLAVHQNVSAGALGRWSTLHALRYLAFPLRAELEDVRGVLARVGIPEKVRAKTRDLSGGERQRVAIARALMQRPEAILADEPVASLDPKLGELLLALARERKIAVLCSLHQPQLARNFDRVIRVENGRLFECMDSAVLSAP